MDRTHKTTAFAVFALSFGVYLITAGPEIAAGDGGELVSAAWLLGIPHPPGYPLFCLMGKLFSFFPFGNVAYRINVMAGFFSAVGVLFVYLCSLELCMRTGISGRISAGVAAGAALCVAFTSTYWAQATFSEVYPLQVSFSVAALYFALRAGRESDFRFAYLSCLIFGLAISGHYAAVLFAPGLFVYIVLSFSGRWNAKKASACIFFVIAGLSAFVYLVPRAAAGPAINWGEPDSASRFLRHVTRASYGDISAILTGLVAPGPVWYKSSSVMVLVLAVLAVAVFIAAKRKWGMPAKATVLGYGALCATLLYMLMLTAKGANLDKISYLFSLVLSDSWPFLLAMSAAGLAALYFLDRRAMYLLGLTLVVTIVVSVYRVPVNRARVFQAFSEKFFMPSAMVAGTLLAAGLASIAGLIRRPGKMTGWAAFLAVAAAFALPAYLVADNFNEQDQSRDFYAYDYSENMLRGMEQGAVFMVEGDNVPSLMAYQQFVERKRTDVDVYEIFGHVFPPFDETRQIYLEGVRPMYHSEAAEPHAFPGITMSLSGIVSRFPGSRVRIADPWKYYYARINRDKMAYADYPTRETVANYLYFRGLHHLRAGRTSEAVADFNDTLRAGYDMVWTWYLVGVQLRDGLGMDGRALELFSRALEIDPLYVNAYIEKGVTLLAMNKPDKAYEPLDRARQLAPNTAEIYCLLAEAAGKRGDAITAAGMKKRCEELSAGPGTAGR